MKSTNRLLNIIFFIFFLALESSLFASSYLDRHIEITRLIDEQNKSEITNYIINYIKTIDTNNPNVEDIRLLRRISPQICAINSKLFRECWLIDSTLTLKLFDENSIEYSTLLNNFVNYSLQFSLDDKQDKLEKSKKIILREYGEQSKEYVDFVFRSYISFYIYERYNYEKGLEILRKLENSIRSKDKIDSLQLSTAYALIADIYNLAGEYSKNEQYYKKVVDLRAKNGGQHFAWALMELGNAYKQMGLYENALENLSRSVEIIDSVLPNKYYNTTAYTFYNDLGQLYSEKNQNDSALKYLFMALEVIDSSRYEKGNSYLITLGNIATVYRNEGNLVLADSFYRESVNIMEMKYKDRIFWHGRVLYSYAYNFHLQKKYDSAEVYYQKALEIFRNSTGTYNYHHQNCVFLYAKLLSDIGDFQKSEQMFSNAMEDIINAIYTIFPLKSDDERAQIWMRFNNYLNIYNSYSARYCSNNSELTSKMLEYNITFNNLINAGIKRSKRIKECYFSDNTEWDDTKSSWLSLMQATELNNQNKAKADSLYRKLREIETNYCTLTDSHEFFDTSRIKINLISSYLKKDEAIVRILRINDIFVKSIDSVSYYAFIITKDKPLTFLKINNGFTIEHTYENYIKLMKCNSTDSKYIDSVLTESYEIFLESVMKYLNKYNNVYISCDGVYHLINLNTLKIPNSNSFVLDKINLSVIPSINYFMDFEIKENKSNEFTLFENPAYSKKIIEFLRSDKGLVISPINSNSHEIKNICSMFENSKWNVKSFSESNANIHNLKNVKSPLILHIITHGFSSDVFQNNSDNDINKLDNENFKIPMLQPILLFAGVDSASLDEKESIKRNGLLTAFEAMDLNLTGTKLVVLEACQSGMGRVRNGDGLSSMDRAFILAGAENIIKSIWNVREKASSVFMELFYQNYLETKPDKRSFKSSFRKAQQFLREKYQYPQLWGSYIFVGK